MGVWIEIGLGVSESQVRKVTPCVGVWIEMEILRNTKVKDEVTPCVGVWIEMGNEYHACSVL